MLVFLQIIASNASTFTISSVGIVFKYICLLQTDTNVYIFTVLIFFLFLSVRFTQTTLLSQSEFRNYGKKNTPAFEKKIIIIQKRSK